MRPPVTLVFPESNRAPVSSYASVPPMVEHQPRILVVSEDADVIARLRELLAPDGYDVRESMSYDTVADLLAQLGADLLLLDATTSPDQALEVCGELRLHHTGVDVPVLLVAHQDTDEEAIVRGLLAGADDFARSDGRPIELRARVRVQLRNKRYRDALCRVRSERNAFRQVASLDPLTGLPNRRSLESNVVQRMKSGECFAVLFVDIDHFKSINDRFGHKTGDQVLRAVADRLKSVMRSRDFCGRYGGEEFVVLVSGVTFDMVARVAERHREAIAHTDARALGYDGTITASIGVAVFNPDDPPQNATELLHRADTAMYEAKKSGRNRVVVDSSYPPPEGSKPAPHSDEGPLSIAQESPWQR